MKTKLGIVGCGFLGNIVADAWKKGLLPDYELVGVTSRTRASAEKTAANVGCAVCEDVDALLALEPEYIVEAASVESVRAMAIPVLKRGVNLVILSIGAFADLDFYAQVKAAAVEGGAKVHLASGAIGGFDVLQTVTLMAQAQGLPETAGIETHTGAKGFRNTPVWAEHLLTDTEKTTVFTGNAKQAIATFPRRVNVAVATSLATTGPESTGVTMHSVPGWVGDDHCITAEIEGVKAVVDICSSIFGLTIKIYSPFEISVYSLLDCRVGGFCDCRRFLRRVCRARRGQRRLYLFYGCDGRFEHRLRPSAIGFRLLHRQAEGQAYPRQGKASLLRFRLSAGVSGLRAYRLFLQGRFASRRRTFRFVGQRLLRTFPKLRP